MILCVKQFLIELGVKHEDLCCTVQINEVHKPRIKQVLKFWQKLLELSDDQIGNPSFVRTKVQKVYDNYDTYFGICRLKVRRSTYLKYQVLGLIKAMKADILSR